MKIIERESRGRGKGSLVRYEGVSTWYACFYANGKEHRESTGTSDVKAARAFLKAKLDDVGASRRGHTTFSPSSAQRVTVAELLDAWLEDVKLRGLKSAKSFDYHSRAARETFGTWRAVDITAEAVDKWVTTLKAEGLANATCNRRVQCLASAFKLGLTRKRITSAPVFRKLSESGNARRGFFEGAEVARLLPVLPDYLRDLVRFAYLCAWRKSEILALTWQMVDMAAGTLTLPTSKSGRGRVLALAGEALEILKRRESERLVERDGQPIIASYVFHKDGRQIRDFKRAWKTALREAGLPGDKLFHDLRRSGVRAMIRSGVRRDVAKAISGHQTDSMFSRYNISDEGDLREAFERLSVAK